MQRPRVWSAGMAALLLIPLLLGEVAIAEAQENVNALLQGDYAFTVSRVCVATASGGFGPPPGFQLSDFAGVNSTTITGTLTFNADGTGRLTATALFLRPFATFPGAFPIDQFDVESELTYTVRHDRSFTVDFTAILFTERIGPSPVGAMGTVLGVRYDGRIAQDGRTLLLFSPTDINPIVETIIFPPDPNFDRICRRNGSAIKVR